MFEPDFEEFIQLLYQHDVEYLIVGGYAMAFHGKPRYTGDLDIWIKVSDANASKLLNVIGDFGFASLAFQKEDFLKDNLINQIGYPPLRIDILNTIDGVNFDEAFLNRQFLDFDDFEANYIGLSDLILNKKATGRKIDLSDLDDLEKLS